MIATSAIVGHVGELVRAVGEQRRRHQLEHRVLRPGHGDSPAAGRAWRTMICVVARLGTRPAAHRGGRHRDPSPPVCSARCQARRHGRSPSWPDEPSADRRARPHAHATTSSLERADGDGRFVQADGPFLEYERTVEHDGDGTIDRGAHPLPRDIPWFGWLFALPIRWTIARRGHDPQRPPSTHRTPWWAPPDRLTPRQLSVLGLLAAASMASAFINTLFTQTVKFAADDFGVGDSGMGIAGAVVRVGIVLALPVADPRRPHRAAPA